MQGYQIIGSITLLGTLLLAPGTLRAQAAPPLPTLPEKNSPLDTLAQCQEVSFHAAGGHCDDKSCTLFGGAYLRCDDVQLWSEELEVLFDQSRQFAGAKATGNVLRVKGNSAIRCQDINIDGDRIRGSVRKAEVRIRRGKPWAGDETKEGTPNRPSVQSDTLGESRAILHGDLERRSPEMVVLKDADLTLCDCGDAPPSWRLDAKEIHIHEGKRATLYGPQFFIAPFGRPIPLTPPLLPLSVPLERRAMGFLSPRLRFLDGPWPMVDLPFFVPLGDSWDLTPSLGLRTGWEYQRKLKPSRFGASRYGLRVRYRPTENLRGEISTQWTWDRRGYGAYLYAQDKRDAYFAANPGANEAAFAQAMAEAYAGDSSGFFSPAEMASFYPAYLARADLTQRIELRAVQDYRPLPFDADGGFRWLTEVDWVSDDRYRTDFSVSFNDQVAAYLPSRTGIQWAAGPLGLYLEAAYLTRLQQSSAGTLGYLGNELSNIGGYESLLPHPWPKLVLAIHPVAIGQSGLYFLAEAGFEHQAPFYPGRAQSYLEQWENAADAINPDSSAALSVARHREELEHRLSLLHGEGTLALARGLGPLALRAHTTLAGQKEMAWESSLAQWRLGAEAALPMSRTYNTSHHRLSPFVAAFAQPWVYQDANALALARVRSFSLVQPDAFTQGAFGVRQRWLSKGSLSERARLDIDLPIFQAQGEPRLGPLRVRAMASTTVGPVAVTTGMRVALPRDIALDSNGIKNLHDASATMRARLRGTSLTMGYYRLGPEAEKLSRHYLQGVGEMEDVSYLTGAPPKAGESLHYGSISLAHRGPRLNASYRMVTMLPYIYSGGLSNLSQSAQEEYAARPYVRTHSLSLGYQSPCECWGVNLSATFNPRQWQNRDPQNDEVFGSAFAMQVALTIAGQKFGNK